jgi:SOS response regulatory protein OraA/RecX
MPRRNGTQRLEARRERLERHASETAPEAVLNAAARFLEARSRSVEEVRRHLNAAAFPPPLVERAIARLVELGMLDDRAFGRAWVESRDRARPRGEAALRRELSLKGLDRETIAAVLAERNEAAADGSAADGILVRWSSQGRGPERGVSEREGMDRPSAGRAEDEAAAADELAAARLLAKNRAALLRIADPRARRGRAYALLARNGFDPDVCHEAAARFAASEIDPDG